MLLNWVTSSISAQVLWDVTTDFALEFWDHLGIRNVSELLVWCLGNRICFVVLECGVLLIGQWNGSVSAEIHPLIQRKVVYQDTKLLRHLLSKVFTTLGVRRIEVPVLAYAGHSLRRHLREVGFTREGLKRKAALVGRGIDAHIVDVELWSMLREELEA